MNSQPPHPVHPEIGNKLRIYVALVALLHKPPEQSFLSYTLDLKAKFPLSASHSLASTTSSESHWRDYALSLERQLNQMQESTQRIQLGESESGPPSVVELQKVQETALHEQDTAENRRAGEGVQSNRPKKRRKIQDEAQTYIAPFDWNEAMKNLDPVLWPPSFQGDLELLNTLVKLSQSTAKGDARQRIIFLVKKSFTLVGAMLESVLTRPTVSSSLTLLNELAALVPLIIDQSFPTICSSAETDVPVEALVQTVQEQILQTAVLHFRILSNLAASSLLKRLTEGSIERECPPPFKDLRPVLLGLCQGILNSLKPYPQLQSSVSVMLSHSVVTQLRKGFTSLKPPVSNSPSNRKPSSADERIRRLTFKDTFWYLISILNTCFYSVSPTAQSNYHMSPLEEATRTTVLVLLAEILENKDENESLGLVERSMLVGVVEKAWANGWVSFGPQLDDPVTESGDALDQCSQ